MKKRILTVITSIVMSIGLFAGCGQSSNASADAEEKNQATTLNVAVAQYNFPAIVAMEKGFFEEEFGDEVELNVSLFTSGVTAIEAINAGDVDLGFWGDFPEVSANANNSKIKLFACETEAVTSWANLYAQPSLGIASISDLKGHTVGYTVGTNSHKLLEVMLEESGLTDEDVELVSLDTKNIVPSLLSGSIDAAMVNARNAIDPEAATLVATSENYLGTQVFLGGNSDYAEANPDIVTRYIKVLQRACEWIAENPEEAAEITAEFDDLDVETELNYMQSMSYQIKWSDSYVETIQSTIDFCLEQGNIDETIPVENLYDTTYVTDAGFAE